MAADHRFRSITEIWLDGDHYKWRAMRANGVPERFCTGDATDWEKFEAWARTVPDTLRNPLYHWTHMELRRPVRHRRAAVAGDGPGGLRPLQRAARARTAFTAAGAAAAVPRRGRLHDRRPGRHAGAPPALAARTDPDTRVYPTWRPDKALAVEDPAAFNAWVARLEAACGHAVGGRYRRRCSRRSRQRHDVFHDARVPRLGPRARDDVRRGRGRTAEVDRRVRPAARRARARAPPGAAAQVGAPARARALRPRARLGPAVPPRRAAQQQHATAPHARAGHRLRLDRRLRAWPGRWPASSTGSTRRTSWRRRSSTTSTRATTSCLPP